MFSSHIILKQVFSLRLFLIWNIQKHIKIIHVFVRNEYISISKCTVNRNEYIVFIADLYLFKAISINYAYTIKKVFSVFYKDRSSQNQISKTHNIITCKY